MPLERVTRRPCLDRDDRGADQHFGIYRHGSHDNFVLGLSMTSWLSLPLPLDLPGTTGHSSGTCRVYSDWLIQLAGTTSTTGALSVATPLTVGPATLGAGLYHYAYSLDLTANALGLVTTNARLNGFGDGTLPAGGCRLYVNGNNAASTGGKDTTLLVTTFQY